MNSKLQVVSQEEVRSGYDKTSGDLRHLVAVGREFKMTCSIALST